MCKPFLSFLGPSDPPIEARRRQPSDKITNRQIGAKQKILCQVLNWLCHSNKYIFQNLKFKENILYLFSFTLKPGSGGGSLLEQLGPPQRVSWVLFHSFRKNEKPSNSFSILRKGCLEFSSPFFNSLICDQNFSENFNFQNDFRPSCWGLGCKVKTWTSKLHPFSPVLKFPVHWFLEQWYYCKTQPIFDATNQEKI